MTEDVIEISLGNSSRSSYVFVEICAEALESKRDEFMIGYCRDIHVWASDLAKRMVSSRYLLLLRCEKATAARVLYLKIKELIKTRNIRTEKVRTRDAFETVFLYRNDLAKLIGEARKESRVEAEIYHGLSELMVK